jgi:hypothetical protein
MRYNCGNAADACNIHGAPNTSHRSTGRHAVTDSTAEQLIVQMVADGFWRYIDKSGTCWVFQGQLNNWGYGFLFLGKKRIYAHRLAWILERGPIPDGMLVCHDCPGGDNPACVNPDHLFLGTPKQNAQDMVRKGRHNNGRAQQTHCKHGHEFTPENTAIRPDGARRCRQCSRESAQRYDKRTRRWVKRYAASKAALKLNG